MPFRPGQTVRIRSLAAIRATLDADGCLEGLAFQAEMAGFCGSEAVVHRRTDFTCVEGHGLRHLPDAVFLRDLRCDGSAHDGCQRACLLIWKTAWLEAPGSSTAPGDAGWVQALPTRSGERYLCQSTRLLGATRALRRWDARPWLRALWRREMGLGAFLRILAETLFTRLHGHDQPGVLRGQNSQPQRGSLGLRAGERVRVRDAAGVCSELDAGGKNRGLAFIPPMAPWLGQTAEVDFVAERIIHERSGRMIPLQATVVLKGATCGGTCVKDCPRASHLYWRESWLERP